MSVFSHDIISINYNTWITFSSVEKLLWMKDNNVQDVLEFSITDVNRHISSRYRVNEFKKLVNRLRGVNYFRIFLHTSKENNINYCKDINSFGTKDIIKFEAFTDILEHLKNDPLSTLRDECSFFNYAGNFGKFNASSMNSIELGFTDVTSGRNLFPLSGGIAENGLLPINQEIFKIRAAIVIPDIFFNERADIEKWFKQYISDCWTFGMKRTIVNREKAAYCGSKKRALFDDIGFDWRELRSNFIWATCTRGYKADYCTNPEAELPPLSIEQIDKMFEEVNKKSLEELYDMYCNYHLTWQDWYDKGDPNLPNWNELENPKKLVFDDNFKNTAHKEYPLIDRLPYKDLYGFGSEYYWALTKTEKSADCLLRAIIKVIEYQRWLYGFYGLTKFVDEIGGEEKWPSVYNKPEEFKGIPEKPAKIWLSDYNGEEKTEEDTAEYKWEQEYAQLINSYQKEADRLYTKFGDLSNEVVHRALNINLDS